MAVVNLTQLITSAQRFADLENSNFIAQSEWIDYVNFGLYQYWNKINTCLQDYNLTTVYFQLVTNQTDYPLPEDFMYLRGVDCSLTQVIPQNQEWITLMPYEYKERSTYSYPWFMAYNGMFGSRYHILNGTTLRFLPAPIPQLWIRLDYIPVSPTLAEPTDSFNGYNGFDVYVSAWAAYRALTKEESDTTNVSAIIAEWDKTIATNAQDRNRDVGDRCTDVYRRGWWGTW